MMRKGWILIIIAGILAVACDRTPGYVIKPKKMAALLVDVHKGEGVVDLRGSYYRDDSLKKVLKQSIYAKHGVTQEDVDTSLVWYGHNIEEYIKVYEMVIEELEADLKNADIAAEGSTVQMAVVGDSVNAWSEAPFRRFSSGQPSDFMTFRFNSDENWEKGDMYQWRFFVSRHTSPIQLLMCADYSDGTSDYISSRTFEEGWIDMILSTDTAKTVKSVYGVLQLAPKGGEVNYIDSISLVRSRFSPDIYNRSRVKLFTNAKRKTD